MEISQIIAGLPSNIFIILMVLAGIVIFLVLIIYIIKYLMENAPFAYVNARVRSMESRLLDSQKLDKLIESGDIVEVIDILEDTDYGAYITTSNDALLIEKSLDMYLAHVYKVLSDISPGKSKKILKLFEKKYDVQNIKTILRAKHVGMDAESIFGLLIPLGTIPENKLRELCEVKTVDEIMNGLEGTKYSKILSEELATYEQTGRLMSLELALDKYILESLWQSANMEGTNEDIFREFIGTMVDVENLKIILRSKVDGISSDNVLKYVLKAGYELPQWKLKELAESESIEGVISSLEGTKYGTLISEHLEDYERVKSVYVFERALNAYIVKVGKNLSLRQPFGIGPIIGLLTSKEQEIRNLKMIIKGKIEGLPSNEIRELITI
ncbi:MAG TPA: V-type ATP synthase subunit C [Methanothermococcus okinawensis]|uniref:A-type ATP synthase subunit C n=1 Tax=Methanothermococcus okinawensis TaxID=155863 RepID=A0A832YU18_9EURY|nr:V-type ATP synthase subunit C [Methanothermococcus okinawensis]